MSARPADPMVPFEPTFDPDVINEAFRKLEELTRPPRSIDDLMRGVW